MKLLFITWISIAVVGFFVNLIRWRKRLRGAKGLEVTIANIQAATGNIILTIWLSALTVIVMVARNILGWRP